MSTAEKTSKKETIRRLHDAVEGGVELISQTIDEIFEPNVLFHAPVRTGATGTEAPSPTTRSSSVASPTAGSLRSGGSSTSSPK
jgi:hypothetical protein